MFGKTNISSKLIVNYSNFTPLNDFVLICACLVGGAGKYSEEPYQNTSKLIKMDERSLFLVNLCIPYI